MKKYVLDTNILLASIRNAPLYAEIELALGLHSPDSIPMISVVTHAELLALGQKLQWGVQKRAQLQAALDKIITIDIRSGNRALLNAYMEIDAFSQGKHPRYKTRFSARNMGKNDLWIASTASVTGAGLVTMDKDFNHLADVFLDLHYFKPSLSTSSLK